MTKVADLDFEILSENWTKYRLLSDNTILRVRIAVKKLLQIDSETSDPSIAAQWQTIVSVIVPESLLKKKGNVPVQIGETTSAQICSGTDMEVKPLDTEEHWQKYRTSNGWIVMVKPQVERAVRLPTYVEIGNTNLMEPLYWVDTNMSLRTQATLGIKGIDSSFTIKEGKERLETKNFWAKFRIKKDEERGDQYIDVLIGKKDETEPHSHFGINLDMSTRFVEPRGVLNTLRREIDSKQMGRLANDTIEYSEPGEIEGKFVFQIMIDGSTRTITPRFEEARAEEKSK